MARGWGDLAQLKGPAQGAADFFVQVCLGTEAEKYHLHGGSGDRPHANQSLRVNLRVELAGHKHRGLHGG